MAMEDVQGHPPRWAPRLKPYLIRRLYEQDAQGRVDDELLDQVGWALHARCDSFVIANRAMQGWARCAACQRDFQQPYVLKTELVCPVCGWRCPWRDYLNSIKGQQLNGGPEVVALFQEYLQDFPLAQTSTQKMILIDRLIHGFHHYLTSKRTRRPVAVNLLDGNLDFVIDFLNRLTFGPDSAPGVAESQAQWRRSLGLTHPSPRSSK